MDKRTCEIGISILKDQATTHKAKQVLTNLRDVLTIEAVRDPIIQRELLHTLIRTLKALELSEEQAITCIRAITTNEEILAILNANPETSKF